MKKYKKLAAFGDIHFGKKANSETHNKDCLRYLEWFCDIVKNDPEIDYITFLGDWNENRSALNIQTLNYSYRGAKMLNDLGLPVYFIIGNHDLYHRHTREIHSVIPFNEFDNFILIEEPTVIDDIEGRVLFCPYMFHEEYKDLIQYFDIPFWAGHFEFRGFEVTGYGTKMPTGPDPFDFKGPEFIVSGHFHKRQSWENNNIVYIGNAFPLDFGDAGDTNRGCMVYDHTTKNMIFHNWAECPKYIKTTLTDILDNTVTLYPGSQVKCLVDIPITFEESTALRQSFVDRYKLREFTLEESPEIKEVLTDTKINRKNTELASIDEMVEQLLSDISSEHIQNDMLVKIYRDLETQKNNNSIKEK